MDVYGVLALRRPATTCIAFEWSRMPTPHLRIPRRWTLHPVGGGCCPGALCTRGRAWLIEDCGYPSSHRPWQRCYSTGCRTV